MFDRFFPRLDVAISLRGRLTIAFLATAIAMGLPAAAGVYLLSKAGERISFLTGVVSPMRAEGGMLVDSLQVLRDTLQVGLSSLQAADGSRTAGADPDVMALKMASIERDWRATIMRLGDLAEHAGVDLPLVEAERLHAEAMRLAVALLDSDRAEVAAAAARDNRLIAFRRAHGEIERLMDEIASTASARMSVTKDWAGMAERAGTATPEAMASLLSEIVSDIYPRLFNASGVRQAVAQMDEVAKVHAALRYPAYLDMIENEAMSLVRVAAVHLRQLSVRLEADGQGDMALMASDALEDLRTALAETAGAFSRQREAHASAAEAERVKQALVEVEADFRRLLSDIIRKTKELEASVTVDADRWSRAANAGMIAAAIAATTLAISFGMVSTRRLTRPLERLNEAVTALAEGRPVADVATLVGADDIGTAVAAVLERTAYLATHDGLTGLPNRALFHDRLTRSLAECHRDGGAVAVLYLDLDKFKEVNDSLGHAAGDRLLVQVAARIKATLRESDTLARLGGDEFAVIQRGAMLLSDAEAVCARIIAVLTEPFDLDGHIASIGVSIGVSMRADKAAAAPPGILVQEADVALYRAKEEGRGTFRFFQEEMNRRLQERKAMEADLRRALAEGQLRLHYQPQVSTDGQRLVGAEALIRWHHPERGDIRPDQFIPLAEETGLIIPIGDWVMRTACQQTAQWPTLRRVAVNVSPVQFRQAGFVARVREALTDSGLEPARLELEITEGILLSDTEDMLVILAELRELGVSIAMDDFGTGYSSLGYLRKFRFDKIKIDRSFIRNLANCTDSSAIIRAILGMSHALGMRSNAEGVEDEEQMTLLGEEGCDEAQGFLFGRPMSVEDFAAYMASRNKEETVRTRQSVEAI